MSTKIEWTEDTWNPVRGCSPISPGCANCYAERQGGRFCGPGKPFDGFIQIGKNGNPGPHWTGKVELIPHMLDLPMRRRKPTTYFANSMSDLFHEGLSFEDIDRVFAVMALCCAPACSRRFNLDQHPEHTFQVLTKRERRMREYFARLAHSGTAGRLPDKITDACHDLLRSRPKDSRNLSWDLPGWPLPNVWLGVSVEDKERADKRIPELQATPAAVRFLSVEPLLGPVGIRPYLEWSATGGIDWVIVGGESGPGARPCDVAWIRSIVAQCKAAGVPCFVKQLGAKPRGPEQSVPDWVARLNSKGGNWEQWPEDLRVREMPGEARRSA